MKNFIQTAWSRLLSDPILSYTRWRSEMLGGEIYIADVDPSNIKYAKLLPPKKIPVIGEDAIYGAVDGPWDYFKTGFENHHMYESFRQRIKEEKEWAETPISSHKKYSTNSGLFRKECEKNDKLISSIQSGGYKTQEELGGNKLEINSFLAPDEPIVGMGRNGELIQLFNGRHRISVAKLLGIDSIPVNITIYHPNSYDRIPEQARRLTHEYEF